MKIYNYSKGISLYTRYGSYRMIKNKMLYRIRSISDSDSYCIILEQDTLQNRPFKVFTYSLCSTNRSTLIRQEIITNNRYRQKEKERIHRSVKYLIHDINSKNMNCSKSDIQILYRVMNHFIYKNKINSI